MQLVLFAASGIGLSLGIFGSGGSVLTLPLLVYLLNQEAKVAVAGSLFIVALISGSTLLFGPARRQIVWRIALMMAVAGILGSQAGAWLAGAVRGEIQLLTFAMLMLLAAGSMWKTLSTTPNKTNMAKVFVAGLGAGALTSFTGAGGGFILLPLLSRYASLDFFHARATSLLLIFSNALFGLSANLYNQPKLVNELDWMLLVTLGVIGVVGSLAGQHWSANWPQQALRRGFAVLLALIALFIISHNLMEVI
ncbi:sulfite exporter TauE/SafE family protein [Bowmanella dokdonensis]|uniref:Probable membrane transporter protein n=1 Tax=Bowmanella dokdonensis TaxID=751969 RepID=A0A939DLK5_9ALTE|nr:sulfite exporter TauE/SafE family protein [Bowmanella dokdonensis]MBN7824810.1 sulfite exporter TauE/SafE family protein [Bowmanella dokdonensis]